MKKAFPYWARLPRNLFFWKALPSKKKSLISFSPIKILQRTSLPTFKFEVIPVICKYTEKSPQQQRKAHGMRGVGGGSRYKDRSFIEFLCLLKFIIGEMWKTNERRGEGTSGKNLIAANSFYDVLFMFSNWVSQDSISCSSMMPPLPRCISIRSLIGRLRARHQSWMLSHGN